MSFIQKKTLKEKKLQHLLCICIWSNWYTYLHRRTTWGGWGGWSPPRINSNFHFRAEGVNFRPTFGQQCTVKVLKILEILKILTKKKTKKIYHFARTNYNIYNVYVYGRIGTHTFIGERPGGAGGAGAPLE